MTTSESPKIIEEQSDVQEDVPGKSVVLDIPLSSEESTEPIKTEENEDEKEIDDKSGEEGEVEKKCEKFEITPILYKALFNGNPKDRFFILRLERDLRNFISSETVSWRLQPLNSYYRLLVHQIAAYYTMGHILLKDGASMVIFKENTSIVNGNNITKTDSNDVNAKLSKLKLCDIPNDLFKDIEISNDISDDFLVRNGLYHNSHQHHHHHNNNNHHNQQQQQQQQQYRQLNNGNNNQRANYIPRNANQYNNQNNNNNQNNKPFKLIKRTPSQPSTSAQSDAESSSQTQEPSDTSLEDQRLSKEELYNKAREEIFQNGDDEDEEVEEDVEVDVEQNQYTTSNSTSRYNKDQFQRKAPFKYYANNYIQAAYPPASQVYASYGYYVPPPPNVGPGIEGYDEDMVNQQLLAQQQQQQQQLQLLLLLLLQYQVIYANGPGAPQLYYYPVPQYNNNRRGGFGYNKRGNYDGQNSRRYHNNNNSNYHSNGNSETN